MRFTFFKRREVINLKSNICISLLITLYIHNLVTKNIWAWIYISFHTVKKSNQETAKNKEVVVGNVRSYRVGSQSNNIRWNYQTNTAENWTEVRQVNLFVQMPYIHCLVKHLHAGIWDKKDKWYKKSQILTSCLRWTFVGSYKNCYSFRDEYLYTVKWTFGEHCKQVMDICRRILTFSSTISTCRLVWGSGLGARRGGACLDSTVIL